MDAIRLDGADAFADILRRHPQVERVVCGHLHRSVQAMVGGRLAMSAPQPRHQVVLDLTRDAPSRFVIEPPSYLLHLWHPESGLISHTVTIGGLRRSLSLLQGRRPDRLSGRPRAE